MKKTLLFCIGVLMVSVMDAQIYMAKTCVVKFFSSSPLENIEAINRSSKPILNTSNNDVAVQIAMMGFVFEKPLMQEHFNENYVESDKFPNAVFRGRINEKIDWSKDGEHKVTVTGKLTIHGVEKERTIDGLVIIKGNQISVNSKFNVHIADHGIKVPSLYIQNIAEDVEVTIDAQLEPFKKK